MPSSRGGSSWPVVLFMLLVVGLVWAGPAIAERAPPSGVADADLPPLDRGTAPPADGLVDGAVPAAPAGTPRDSEPQAPLPGPGGEAPAPRACDTYPASCAPQPASGDDAVMAVADARVRHHDGVPPGELVTAALGAGVLAILVGLLLRFLFTVLAWTYGLLPAGWRLERDAVVAHPTRQAILDHLVKRPGATLMELAGVVSVRGSRAAYHLMILMREDLVTVRELDGRKVYFSRQAPRADLEEVSERHTVRLFAHPGRAPGRVLAHIRHAPGATVSQLATALGFAPGHAHYHLTRLAERGFIERVKRGRWVRHYLTERGRTILASAQDGAAPVMG